MIGLVAFAVILVGAFAGWKLRLPKHKPANARDQWWLGQATTLAGKIGDARWLLAQQVGEGTPKLFVALLIFWLALLFASFGLFAPHNLTSAAMLTLSALL